MFIGRRYMGEILSIRHNTLSNQSIIAPCTCMYMCFKIKKKITMSTFYFIDALLTKVFFKIFHNPSMLNSNISEKSKDMHINLN